MNNEKSIDDIISASSLSEALSAAVSDKTNVDVSRGDIKDPNIESSLLNLIKAAGFSETSLEAIALKRINKKYGNPRVDIMSLEDFIKRGMVFKTEIDDISGVTNEDLKFANYTYDDKTGKYYKVWPRAFFTRMSDDDILRQYRKKTGKYAYKLKDEKGIERATIIRDEAKEPLLRRLFGVGQRNYQGGDFRSDEVAKILRGKREVVPDDFEINYKDNLHIPSPRPGNLYQYFAELAHAAQLKGLNYEERLEDSRKSTEEGRRLGGEVYYTPGAKEYEAHRGGKHGRGIAGDLKNEYSDLVKALSKAIPIELLFE
tara:strand:+ start:556 stop:1500 length:945 start_codon:yes stop_codon:yes gene_type:complete